MSLHLSDAAEVSSLSEKPAPNKAASMNRFVEYFHQSVIGEVNNAVL